MKLPPKIFALLRAPKITRPRILLAVAVAVVTDAAQIPLQIIPGAPEVLDVLAMTATSALLGFHFLLLPTFAVEFIPGLDIAPTWTGCVIAVIAIRKNTAPK